MAPSEAALRLLSGRAVALIGDYSLDWSALTQEWAVYRLTSIGKTAQTPTRFSRLVSKTKLKKDALDYGWRILADCELLWVYSRDGRLQYARDYEGNRYDHG